MDPAVPASPISDQVALELGPRLRRIVGQALDAPEWVLDEACQAAWVAFVVEAPPLDDADGVLGWLATTARRETLHLLRILQRDLPEEGLERAAAGRAAADPTPQDAAEFWERMGRLRRLSRRQQRYVWMQGLGYGYGEIARRCHESPRTVERQLLLARRQLRAAA